MINLAKRVLIPLNKQVTGFDQKQANENVWFTQFERLFRFFFGNSFQWFCRLIDNNNVHELSFHRWFVCCRNHLTGWMNDWMTDWWSGAHTNYVTVIRVSINESCTLCRLKQINHPYKFRFCCVPFRSVLALFFSRSLV